MIPVQSQKLLYANSMPIIAADTTGENCHILSDEKNSHLKKQLDYFYLLLNWSRPSKEVKMCLLPIQNRKTKYERLPSFDSHILVSTLNLSGEYRQVGNTIMSIFSSWTF